MAGNNSGKFVPRNSQANGFTPNGTPSPIRQSNTFISNNKVYSNSYSFTNNTARAPFNSSPGSRNTRSYGSVERLAALRQNNFPHVDSNNSFSTEEMSDDDNIVLNGNIFDQILEENPYLSDNSSEDNSDEYEMNEGIAHNQYIQTFLKLKHAQPAGGVLYGKLSSYGRMAFVTITSVNRKTVAVYAVPVRLNAISGCWVKIQPVMEGVKLESKLVKSETSDISQMPFPVFASLPQARIVKVLRWPTLFSERVCLSRQNIYEGRKNKDDGETQEFRDKYLIFVANHQQFFIDREDPNLDKETMRVVKLHLAHKLDARRLQHQMKGFEITLARQQKQVTQQLLVENKTLATSVRIESIKFVEVCSIPSQLPKTARVRLAREYDHPDFIQPEISYCHQANKAAFLEKVGVSDFTGREYFWAAVDTKRDRMHEDAFAVVGNSVYFALATPAPWLAHMGSEMLQKIFTGFAECPVAGYNGAFFGKHLLPDAFRELCELNWHDRDGQKGPLALVVEIHKRSRGVAEVVQVSLGYIGKVHSFTFEDEHNGQWELMGVLSAAHKVLNGAMDTSIGDELVREEILTYTAEGTCKGTRIQSIAIKSNTLLRTLTRMTSVYCGRKMFESGFKFIAKEERAPMHPYFTGLKSLPAWSAIQEILQKAPVDPTSVISPYGNRFNEQDFLTLSRERKCYLFDEVNYGAVRNLSDKTTRLLKLIMELIVPALTELNVRDLKMCSHTPVHDYVHNEVNVAPMNGALRDATAMFNHLTWMQVLLNEAEGNGIPYTPDTVDGERAYPNLPGRRENRWFPHAAVWEPLMLKVVERRRHLQKRGREILAEQKLLASMRASKVIDVIVTGVSDDLHLQNEFWGGRITMQSIQFESRFQHGEDSTGEKYLDITFTRAGVTKRFRYGDTVKVGVTGVPHNGTIQVVPELLFVGDPTRELNNMDKYAPVDGDSTAQLWNCLSSFRIEECVETYADYEAFRTAQGPAFQHMVVCNSLRKNGLDTVLTLRKHEAGHFYFQADLAATEIDSADPIRRQKRFLAHVWFEHKGHISSARFYLSSMKNFVDVQHASVTFDIDESFVNERHPQENDAWELLKEKFVNAKVCAKFYHVHLPDWVSLKHSWNGVFKGILGASRQFTEKLKKPFLDWLNDVAKFEGVKGGVASLMSSEDYKLLQKFHTGQRDFLHRVIAGSFYAYDGYMPMAAGPAGSGKTTVMQFAIGLLCMRTFIPRHFTGAEKHNRDYSKPICILYMTQANPAGQNMFERLTEMKRTWPGIRSKVIVKRHVSYNASIDESGRTILADGEFNNLTKLMEGVTSQSILIICTTADLFLMKHDWYAKHVVIRGLVVDEVQNQPDPKLCACVEIAYSTRPKDTKIPFTCFAGGDPLQLKAMQTSLLQRNMGMDLLTRMMVSYVRWMKGENLDGAPDIYPLTKLCRFHHKKHCDMIVKLYQEIFEMAIECDPIEKDDERHNILMELPAFQTLECEDEEQSVIGTKSWANPSQDQILLNHLSKLMPWLDQMKWPESAEAIRVLLMAVYQGDVDKITELLTQYKNSLGEDDRLKFEKRFKINVVTVESIGGQQADIAYVVSTRASRSVGGKPAGLDFWTSDKVVTAVTRQMYMLVVVGCPSWMKACHDNKFSQIWNDMIEMGSSQTLTLAQNDSITD